MGPATDMVTGLWRETMAPGASGVSERSDRRTALTSDPPMWCVCACGWTAPYSRGAMRPAKKQGRAGGEQCDRVKKWTIHDSHSKIDG